ncbi:3-oxoacyl-ACP synthase III family protein [Parabacteroides faecis]|uniref:3-oxoacyl-[acyl-carrier-protein] synthase-3 n=1 Tax=Parabacteroides faecis TaxID=1217282 RepID=A0ABR6KLG2_9BACT|nr:ketoacyl-ACP synthase III [Parabacteroides faecis]MBB4622337.1 3-oxoacyl-[acyl-carrier-protein] synthase-3 [Parabacteroides faecis]GGK11236.1 3-oxoacyl-ACP synthase [Parabacteroides faecis]
MAIASIKNVKIAGMAACVPERIEENRDYTLLPPDEIEKYIETTGVERRHCAIHDGSICTSDLCQKATEGLLEKLGWVKEEVDLIVFVSQTCDYRLPSTGIVLQDKMGFPKSTLAFDITLGCSGFVVGLGVAGNMVSTGNFKKCLLMVGNTQSEYANYKDKSMWFLLGDAGTVTALEYNPEEADKIDICYSTDGSGRKHVIVPDGGSRNPVSLKSFEEEAVGDGNFRTRLDEKMDGVEVFAAAITGVPKLYKQLLQEFNIDNEKMDYCLIHQASKVLFEKLRKKLKFPEEKTPMNLKDFGNTSGATIPLLMVCKLKEELESRPLEMVMAAVGVGFSIGTGRITTNKIKVCDLMYL